MGSKLTIDFPFANIADVQAEVVGWHPVVPEPQRRRDGPPSDLAVLKLPDTDRVASIDACLIAETDAEANTPFACQGYPIGYPNGALAEGVLRGSDAGGWIDAVADAAFGHFIEPGFSGAPVFARQRQSNGVSDVLGICVTADVGGKRVARLIPPVHLAQALRLAASPYRWLEHFDQRHAAYFFGRDRLISELWEELRRQRFLLLAGPSGSGKSSILHAGLMAIARRADIRTLLLRPYANARMELARLLDCHRSPYLLMKRSASRSARVLAAMGCCSGSTRPKSWCRARGGTTPPNFCNSWPNYARNTTNYASH
jgi:hypothetical protein